MGFVPRPLPAGNVNVSQTHPLKRALRLFLSLLLILGLAYWLLGLVVDQVVPHISFEQEQRLGQAFSGAYLEEQAGDQHMHLQALANDLSRGLSPQPLTHLHYLPSETVNALALPGGEIIVYGGLIEQAQSENEIAFVLGHEIGHIVHRHALRRMGRAVLLALGAQLFFAQQSPVQAWVQGTLTGVNLTYSRAQEAEADQMGLDLLAKHYGHAAGATAFFKRLAQSRDLSLFSDYLSSHPAPEKRVLSLEKQIKERKLRIGELSPWPIPVKKTED